MVAASVGPFGLVCCQPCHRNICWNKPFFHVVRRVELSKQNTFKSRWFGILATGIYHIYEEKDDQKLFHDMLIEVNGY